MTQDPRIQRGPVATIRRGVLGLIAVPALVAFGCSAEPPAPDLTSIDEVLRSAVERGDVPGLVAAAVGPSGVVYEGLSSTAGAWKSTSGLFTPPSSKSSFGLA